MVKNGKGFGTPLVKVTDAASSPNVADEQQVLDKLGQEKLAGVRQILDAGKAALAATQSVSSNSQVIGIKQSAEVTEATEPEVKPEPVAEPPAPVNQGIDPAQLAALMQDAIAQSIRPLQEQNNQLQQQLEEAKQAAQQQVAEAQAKAAQTESILQALNGIRGNPQPVTPAEMPMVNTGGFAKSDVLPGMVREFFSVYDKAKAVRKASDRSEYVVRDNLEINRYVHHAMRTNQRQFLRDMEAWGKANGLMRGSNSSEVVTNAATTISDIPGGFLDVLSAIMRTNNRQAFVFWQFPTTRIEFAKGMGDTIKIPRAAFQTAPSTPDDRLLSGGGTFVNIDPGNQSIATGVATATLQEWGLGKNASHPPVSIPTFVSAYSMIDLMQVLQRNLMKDYYAWEDLKIRSLWDPTSRVVYNAANAVDTTPGNVPAGSGHPTRQFLNNLFGYMKGLLIPTYMDGCYGLVMPSLSWTALANSFDERYQIPSKQALEDLLSVINPSQTEFVDRVNGYVGTYCGFHIFETNAYGCGAAGTEGAQTTAFAASSETTRTSYAFGADTIGRGIGTEVEIRRDINDGFGRLNRYIWREESGFVAMDVDPTGYSDSSTVPQQLRVIDVRLSDTAATA